MNVIKTLPELALLVAQQPSLLPEHEVWTAADERKLDRLIADWVINGGDEKSEEIDKEQERKVMLGSMWNPAEIAADALELRAIVKIDLNCYMNLWTGAEDLRLGSWNVSSFDFCTCVCVSALRRIGVEFALEFDDEDQHVIQSENQG